MTDQVGAARLAEIRAETWGHLADAVAAVEEAALHDYSPEAALLAAFDHLAGADRHEALKVAAALAMLVVFEMRPTTCSTLPVWLELKAAFLSGRDIR